jgi:clathrin heavy chain
MDSGKFICIRETEAKSVAIIDTANPTNIVRMPAPVELACVSPDGATLVVGAATAVQMFVLETKTPIKSAALPEPAVFLKWISPEVVGIVTASNVYHWPLEGGPIFINYQRCTRVVGVERDHEVACLALPPGGDPVVAFARDASLAASQIINYKCSDDNKWMLVNGIAAGADGNVTGQLQLYSVEKRVSQPVPAHAGGFANIAADDALMFVFADKAGAGGTVSPPRPTPPHESRTFPPWMIPMGHTVFVCLPQNKCTKIGGDGAALAPAQVQYGYPPNVAQQAPADFPVAMIPSSKYDVAYMLTKLGFLFVIDTKTCALIFTNQVSAQPVFIAAAHEATGGIVFVNQGGQVLSVTLDEDNVIEYIATQQRNIEVAQRLSARNSLPGAVIDQMLQQQFEALFQQSNFAGCAELCMQAEKLRTATTIQRLKAAPAAPGAPPPVMVYYQTLLNKTKLNSAETVGLINELLPMGQIAFIEQKLAEDKIACTGEVGDLIKSAAQNMQMAMQIYMKGKCHGKVVLGFIESGQADKVPLYLDQAGASGIDWLATLEKAVAINPQVGFGRIVALHDCAPTLYQLHSVNWCLFFSHDNATERYPQAAQAAADAVLKRGEPLDMAAVADLFVKKSAIQEATAFLVTALTAKGASVEEDGDLQTKVMIAS